MKESEIKQVLKEKWHFRSENLFEGDQLET
jgi:hypothetical protein